MFNFADKPQKVDNIHRAICIAYSCSSSIHFKSEVKLFRLRKAVTAIFCSLLPKQPRFQSNEPSISLVSNQMHHRIDGVLLVSSKYGKRPLVMENWQGHWSQSKTAKYFERIIINIRVESRHNLLSVFLSCIYQLPLSKSRIEGLGNVGNFTTTLGKMLLQSILILFICFGICGGKFESYALITALFLSGLFYSVLEVGFSSSYILFLN